MWENRSFLAGKQYLDVQRMLSPSAVKRIGDIVFFLTFRPRFCILNNKIWNIVKEMMKGRVG